MATWNNEQKLDMLKVAEHGDTLHFEAGDEKAIVHIKNGTIDKVEFSHKGKNTTISIKEAHAVVVGEKNWQRDVYHFLKPNGHAPTMRLGITVHRGEGTWSSLPHDFENHTEPGFEEVFYYILKGGPERGVQMGRGVWYDNTPVDDAWTIKNKTFSTVPMGYHPVVGEPGVHVSYIWVYLAKKKSWEKI
jgi:5-deoxy-D-glucuronate isomerase